MKEIIQTLSVESHFHSSDPITQEIREILLDCQAQAIQDQEDKIISICQPLPLIDPLEILQQFHLDQKVTFYWENQHNQEAIAAIGSVEQLIINDNVNDRFFQVQAQIKNWQKRIINIGNQSNLNDQNRFFCGFTFLETSQISETSPFSNGTVVLPKLQFIKKQNQCFCIKNFLITPQINIDIFLEENSHNLLQNNWIHVSQTIIKNHKKNAFNPYLVDQNLEHFRQSVISALESIEKQKFSKLVIAHIVDLISTTPFPLIHSLNNLRKQYKNCYIFAFGNGKGSHFLGASPERLLETNNQHLMSDAIAGSAPRGNTSKADFQLGHNLLNNEKERREHQAVVTFISQRLEALNLKVKIAPTTLLKLSNIQHLWTPIYSSFPSYLHPLEIVSQLHPTPAVSGVPTSIACEEIQRYEPFDRGLYASPIGWIDQKGNSQFVVGIRSALVMENKVRLYAGAGIVAGSNPDQEVAEIQLKLQAMLKTFL